MANQFERDRSPVVGGMFYPDDPQDLKQQIDFYIQNLEEKTIVGQLSGIVAPHAGYMFSGQVAAAAYKHLIDREYKTVVVIAPSHREYFNGISLLPCLHYVTPLGKIKIARELCHRIAEQDELLKVSWEGHREEHALEVQLPFLQRTLGEFDLVPIVMGDQMYDSGVLLGEVLAKIVRHENSLIVASSDLSHYYPAKDAEQKDNQIIEKINTFDYDGLWDVIESRNSEACGAAPILATMIASKRMGANKSEVLLYQHSGHVTGDQSAVVGYLAAAFYKQL